MRAVAPVNKFLYRGSLPSYLGTGVVGCNRRWKSLFAVAAHDGPQSRNNRDEQVDYWALTSAVARVFWELHIDRAATRVAPPPHANANATPAHHLLTLALASRYRRPLPPRARRTPRQDPCYYVQNSLGAVWDELVRAQPWDAHRVTARLAPRLRAVPETLGAAKAGVAAGGVALFATECLQLLGGPANATAASAAGRTVLSRQLLASMAVVAGLDGVGGDAGGGLLRLARRAADATDAFAGWLRAETAGSRFTDHRRGHGRLRSRGGDAGGAREGRCAPLAAAARVPQRDGAGRLVGSPARSLARGPCCSGGSHMWERAEG